MTELKQVHGKWKLLMLVHKTAVYPVPNTASHACTHTTTLLLQSGAHCSALLPTRLQARNELNERSKDRVWQKTQTWPKISLNLYLSATTCVPTTAAVPHCCTIETAKAHSLKKRYSVWLPFFWLPPPPAEWAYMMSKRHRRGQNGSFPLKTLTGRQCCCLLPTS